MKYFIVRTSIAAIFLAIVGVSFEFNLPLKDTLLAQYHAVQGKGQVAEIQYARTKPNSFSVAKANGENQDDLNSTKAMVHRGKMYLIKQVDTRINQLGTFRDRMQNMAVALNDAEMKSLVSGLTADLDAFEALKAEISQSATNEDIKNIADKIKAAWINSSLSVERAESAVLAAKETELVSDADVASTGIQKRIDVLKAAGKDAKPYEELLAAYNEKVASAKQDMEAANENFKAAANAATDGEKQKLTKGNGLLLSSSQENIRDAYKLLGKGAREDFARKFK
jgi:hypothetical protein